MGFQWGLNSHYQEDSLTNNVYVVLWFFFFSFFPLQLNNRDVSTSGHVMVSKLDLQTISSESEFVLLTSGLV